MSSAIEKTAVIAKIGKPYRIETFPKGEERFFQFFEKYFGDSFEDLVKVKIGSTGFDDSKIMRAFKTNFAKLTDDAILLKSGIYARMLSVPSIE